MDWIRKNKFLAGFLAVIIAGVGGLGYLLYSQMDTYDQTSQDYEAATKELDRLQGLKPFPYQKSKVNLTALRAETSERVTNLQKRLSDYEPPAENPNFKPIEFQDKLRRVVEETTQAASAANVKLPADFYMGFEQYRSTPAEAPAAPLLSRQLDAIQDLMKILIARRIDEVKSIKRAPLAQETPGAAAAPTPRPGQGGKPAPAPPGEAVSRQVVEVAFNGQSSAFQESLDDLVTSKRLFLVRAVVVKNQKPKGAPREAPGSAGSTPASAAAPAPAAPDAAAVPAPDKPALEYVVGLEKIDVIMRVEIVKVAPPTAPATPPAR